MSGRCARPHTLGWRRRKGRDTASVLPAASSVAHPPGTASHLSGRPTAHPSSHKPPGTHLLGADRRSTPTPRRQTVQNAPPAVPPWRTPAIFRRRAASRGAAGRWPPTSRIITSEARRPRRHRRPRRSSPRDASIIGELSATVVADRPPRSRLGMVRSRMR